MKLKLRRTVISSSILFILMSMAICNVTAAPDGTIPTAYYQEYPGLLKYKIRDMNETAYIDGLFIEWNYFDMGTYENYKRGYANASKGKIFQVALGEFYDEELYGDIKINNFELENITNYEMAYVLILGWGSFYYGFWLPTTDMEARALEAHAQSDLGWCTASVNIANDTEAKTVTYTFEQLTAGNQKTVLKYSTETGILLQAETEFNYFWMTIELYEGIPAFEPWAFAIFSIIGLVTLVFSMRKKINK
ncbi:MAG: hypothetical protein GF364_11205 [Candidatus Lokiarchaeota archaeon]|nr:hypothetical protein [Candidatus Lokiarchaeota archaeon]